MLNEQWELLAKWKERARGNKRTRCDLAFGSTTPFPFLCMEDGCLVLVPGASRSMSEPPLELMTILHLVLTLLAAPYPASIKSPGATLCSQLASSSCISVVTLTFVSRKPFLRTPCPTLIQPRKAFGKKKNTKKSVELWALNLPHTQCPPA